MSTPKDLYAKAERFGRRAAAAKGRIVRNTYLSLERSVRMLAVSEECDEAARQEQAAKPQW
jgi:hypothetical protein